MDWEMLFENELVPLVAGARSEAALEKSVGLIIQSLFRRTNDEANREQFWALLQISLARATTFTDKVDSAVQFLRLIKDTRKTLAAQSPNKRIDAGSVSSDLDTVAHVVAPVPVPVPVRQPPQPQPQRLPQPQPQRLPQPQPQPQPKKPKAGAPAEAKPPEEEKVDFAQVFDEVICTYLGQILAELRIDQPGGLQVPFLMHPTFGSVLEQVVRGHVLPEMRNTRHIKTLGDSVNVQDGGSAALLRILTAGEINNPILHTWDRRWDDLVPRRVPGKTTKVLAPDARAAWKEFSQHGEANGYLAPTMKNVELFLTLPRYDITQLRAAWRAISQFYRQEFTPGKHQEQARDGAMRDALFKWEGREGMPPHAMEWLAIKACASFPLLNLAWLERFSTNKGKTREERERAIPFIMQVLQANA